MNSVALMNRLIAPKIERNTVVVLLGWLGAQPRSLRRYETLYRTLLDGSSGTDVPTPTPTTSICIHTYIAPPFTVVQSVLETPMDELIRVPFEWPLLQQSHCHNNNNIRSVQDLAWNILRDIHDCTTASSTIHHPNDDNNYVENNNQNIYIHAFSNGGCFVWEKIRQILSLSVESTDAQENHGEIVNDNNNHYKRTNNEPTDRNSFVSSSTTSLSDVQSRILFQIRLQLRGVVFDSCPISDLHRLPEALQYCTITERIQVLRYCHYKYLAMQIDPQIKEQVQTRITRYITGLQNDPLYIKQLYLYSRDDPLAPSSFIDELVQYRRRRLHEMMTHSSSTSNDEDDGDEVEEMIASCVWEKSQHCGHYVHHPQQYTTAIATLLGRHEHNINNHGNDNNNSNNNNSTHKKKNLNIHLRSKL